MFRDNYSFAMEDDEMIERYDAAQKCLLGMEKVTDDLGALIQAYAELSLSIGNRIRKEISGKEEKTGCLVIYPDGNIFEYPLRAFIDYEGDEDDDDEIITGLGDTDLLFSYSEYDLFSIDDQDYIDGPIQIFKADSEGMILPLTDAEILMARLETMKMVRIVRDQGEAAYMFALAGEENFDA
ncbi:MAG: hypothetical protein PUC99_01465 [Eubacteriales bacterium]|uniref:hypothetical protein n=1 Tax=Oribacterium sp. HCP28S3_H8 TaxID=3438945 RepID=UPI002A55F046|nr:hypothetical protein [Eubacteriales bacterium]